MADQFIFHANALALAGRLSSPTPETVEVQVATVLPPNGGEGVSERSDYTSLNGIHFDYARSVASGTILPSGTTLSEGTTLANDLYYTVAEVVVRGLNIADGLITASSIRATIASRRELPEESNITPLIIIDNLRILGVPLTLVPHSDLVSKATLNEIQSAFARKSQTQETLVDATGTKLEFKPVGKTPEEFADRLILTSLFERTPLATVAGLSGARAVACCGLEIPGHGTIHFGDYLISRDARRLTLLRVELRGRYNGTLVVASVETNGHKYP
jgi:hypothetical protein